MIISDFLCLGRTVPVKSKKYGHKICMAGWSSEMRSLVRIYPLPVVNNIRVNGTYQIEVERNPKDSREESWRLVDGGFLEKVSVGDSTKTKKVVSGIKHSTINQLNTDRKSLGIVSSGDCTGEFSTRHNQMLDQKSLFDFDEQKFGDEAVSLIPYIMFDDKGTTRRIQIREIGCYEWLRKNTSSPYSLWDNLRIGPGYETALLVGNMSSIRTSWLIIKSWSWKKTRALF